MNWLTHCPFSARGRAIPGVVLALGLVGCGGDTAQAPASFNSLEPVSLQGAPRFADGPIRTACSAQTRTTTAAARCGCIQAAANLTLTDAEQKRAVAFFGEPELLQDMKLSDTPANERFWYAWARFAETAEDLCRRT